MLNTFLFLVCIGSIWSVEDAENNVSSTEVIHASMQFEDSSIVLSTALPFQATSPLPVPQTMPTELLLNDLSSSEVFYRNTVIVPSNVNDMSSSSVIDTASSSPGMNVLSSSLSLNAMASSYSANASSFMDEISVFSPLDANSIVTEVNVMSSHIQEMNASSSATNAPFSGTNTPLSETNAPLSETNAPLSETNASLSETNASLSETNAPLSETNAPLSETIAPLSEMNASISEVKAPLSEVDSPLSETNAPLSEFAPLSLTLNEYVISSSVSPLEADIKPTRTIVPQVMSSFSHSVVVDVNDSENLSQTTHFPINNDLSDIINLSTDLKNFENRIEPSLESFDIIEHTGDFNADFDVTLSSTSTTNILQYTELPYSSTVDKLSIVMSPSILQESSTVPFRITETDVQPTEEYSNISFSSIVIFNNESTDDVTTTPADFEHKKLLMLVLRAEDCSRLSKKDFEQMLSKLMAMYELDTIPEIQNTKCYSHLNINFTLSGSKQTIQFLPSMDGKHNLTVDFLNRTFNVVKFERVDLLLEHDRSNYSNSQSGTMAEMKQKVAFIGVAAAIVVVLLVVAVLWVAKCCHARRIRQRFSLYPKGGMMKLRSNDCTLAPLPRPCPVFPECYRDALSGDIYSTSSAGSGADQGFVQSFDTSIVPLDDGVRDFSPDSAQSDMKSFNLQNFGCNALRSADSKERWSARQNKTAGGISNPTFQRF